MSSAANSGRRLKLTMRRETQCSAYAAPSYRELGIFRLSASCGSADLHRNATHRIDRNSNYTYTTDYTTSNKPEEYRLQEQMEAAGSN